MHPAIGTQVRIKLTDLEAALEAYINDNLGLIVDGEIVDIIEEEETDDAYFVNLKLPRVCLYESEFTPAAKRIKK